jgi:hypothetical protein
LRFRHRLRISVDEEYVVFLRSKRFEEEHPKVWHEVAGDAVVGTVQKDVHERESLQTRNV